MYIHEAATCTDQEECRDDKARLQKHEGNFSDDTAARLLPLALLLPSVYVMHATERRLTRQIQWTSSAKTGAVS